MRASNVASSYFPNAEHQPLSSADAVLAETPRLVLLGHLSFDYAEDSDAPEPGGAAAYAALTAKSFGLRAAVLTRTGADYPFEVLDGVPTHRLSSPVTTAFRNQRTTAGRVQSLLRRAGNLSRADVPEAWQDSAAVLFCPLAREFDEGAAGWFPHSVTGAVLQGWLRSWDESGRIRLRSDWRPSHGTKLDFVVASSEELTPSQAARWTEVARIVVLTTGGAGAQILEGGHWLHVPAPRVVEVDSTGAGDVWAATFLTQLLEKDDLMAAARLATCAASLSVTGFGLRGIPKREATERLAVAEYGAL